MSVVALEQPSKPQHDPRTAAAKFTASRAQELLRTKFAPWVQDLGLIVESCWASGAGAWCSPRLTGGSGRVMASSRSSLANDRSGVVA